MSGHILRVKSVDKLPSNPYNPHEWPAHGLYRHSSGYYLVLASVFMTPGIELALEKEEPVSAAPSGVNQAFLLKLVAVSQKPELAKDLT